jgi:hypothetical protein
MAAAATTEFVELKPVRRVLFVLGRHVVALFALRALQNNIVSWHNFSLVQSSAFRLCCLWVANTS